MQTQIVCPRCQTPFMAEIHQVIDAGRNPQLKYELLNGTLNLFVCPNCGTSGQMATPLLYHDPEHELFMVHVPMEMNLPHEEQQRVIGQMVQEAMRQIPREEQRGYMLQPQEVIRYQTFLEKILETEGVTTEMLERQRQQSQLLQDMATGDKPTRERLLEERADMIDETFLAMLRSTIEAAQQQNNNELLIKLTNLQARLLTETEVGRKVEKRQSALRAFQKDVQKQQGLTPEMLAKHVVRNREDEGTVNALISMGQQAFNYEFFSKLTEQVEQAAREGRKEEAKQLTQLRQNLLELQRELQEQSQQVLNQAMDTLQSIMEAEDQKAAVQENLGRIDDTFMYVLSAMIAQTEQQGQTEQVRQLRRVQELIMEEAEQQVPPQIRVINRLLRAESEADQRRILDENSEQLTPELVQMLGALAQEIEADGQGEGAEMAERIRQVQAMVEMRVGQNQPGTTQSGILRP